MTPCSQCIYKWYAELFLTGDDLLGAISALLKGNDRLRLWLSYFLIENVCFVFCLNKRFGSMSNRLPRLCFLYVSEVSLVLI